MTICALCPDKPCTGMKGNYPPYCPIYDCEWLDAVKKEYSKEENRAFSATACYVEKTGYTRWTRLQETVEFAKKAGFGKIGLVFCSGLSTEAKIVSDYYKRCGLEVISAVCCCGAIDKSTIGIPEEYKFKPNEPESMCNPIGQALLMNKAETQFNVVLGLCVGHDSLFFKYAAAPTTVLVAKDRALGHNPVAAIYGAKGYMKKRLAEQEIE